MSLVFINPISRFSVVMLRHRAVANWTRRSDIFTKDYIIIPINENLHWFLGLVCFPWMVGMVSYNKLYAEYNYDQCQLNPDFADTTFDPCMGDVGNEDIKVLPGDIQVRDISQVPFFLYFNALS